MNLKERYNSLIEKLIEKPYGKNVDICSKLEEKFREDKYNGFLSALNLLPSHLSRRNLIGTKTACDIILKISEIYEKSQRR